METVDLAPLLSKAFLVAEAKDANAALAEAREQVGEGAFSWEIVVPASPDRGWLEAKLLARLVYHCESSQAALPSCGKVFVSFFAGDRLHCVAAKEVVAFGGALLGLGSEQLVERFGTGEARVAVKPPIALLPGG